MVKGNIILFCGIYGNGHFVWIRNLVSHTEGDSEQCAGDTTSSCGPLSLRGRSPQANYTDRATAACRRS
jgi:hypothetical protein